MSSISRADLIVVEQIVYDNLSVSLGNGTFDSSNKRFREDYLKSAIAFADIRTVNILLKSKQDFNLTELYQTQSGISSGSSVNQNWAIISVTDDTTTRRSVELPWDKYRLLTYYGSGVFDTTNYKGYHSFQDGKIFTIMSGTCTITYINLTHQPTISGLKSPTGFESVVASFATAHLLMKRLDKPDEAKYYEGVAYNFLQEYGIKAES